MLHASSITLDAEKPSRGLSTSLIMQDDGELYINLSSETPYLIHQNYRN